MKPTTNRPLFALLAVCALIIICLSLGTTYLSSTNADLVADNKSLTDDLIRIQKSATEISVANDGLNALIDKQAQQIADHEQTISNLEAKSASQAEGISELKRQMFTIQDSMPVQITLLLNNEEGETYSISWWAFATASDMEDVLHTNRMSIVDPIVNVELFFPVAENISYVNVQGISCYLDRDNRVQVPLDASEVGSYYFQRCFQIRFEDYEEHSMYLDVAVKAGPL